MQRTKIATLLPLLAACQMTTATLEAPLGQHEGDSWAGSSGRCR